MSLAIHIDVPAQFKTEACYTVDNLFFPFQGEASIVEDIAALNAFEKKILYCHERSPILSDPRVPNTTLIIVLENRTLAFFEKFRAYPLNEIEYRDHIPCLFPYRGEQTINDTPQNHTIFSFDIIAAAFFFLSCWQEYAISDRDWKGRIPLSRTLQYRLGIIRTPIVNQYLILLNHKMEQIWGAGLTAKPMPGGGPVYTALSHDVDDIDTSIGKYVNGFREKKNRTALPLNLLYMLRNLWGKKYLFNIIQNLESSQSARSTFFFLGAYPLPKHKRYAASLIDQLEPRSFEVGHHLSDKSILGNTLLKDHNHFLQIKGDPGRDDIRGERVHTLKFNVHRLFSLLEEHGYHYDNSLLFAEDIGYRTGFTYPHYLFDPIRKRPFKVVAIPLNIMDGTLIDSKYLFLSDEEAAKTLFTFLQSVIPFGGSIAILFHPNFFHYNTQTRLKIYHRLLGFFKQRQIKVGPLRNLYGWRTPNANHSIQ